MSDAQSNTTATTPVVDPNPEETRLKLLAEIEKLKVEAEKTRQEVENAKHEDARKDEKHRAEIAILNASLASTQAQSDVAGLVLARERRAEDSDLARDRYHFTYQFNTSVNEAAVVKCIAQITEWTRNAGDKKLDIQIIFDSPGGSAFDGMHLFDYLQSVRRQGHTVRTTAYGMAASMAGILLQAGDVRALGRESYILVHEVTFGAGGKIGEVIDEVKLIEKMQNRVLDIFADRAARAIMARDGLPETAYEATRKERRKFFARSWKRTDWWLSSDEALECGLVDELL